MKRLFLVLTLFLLVMVPQVQALTLENVSVLNNSDSYKGGTPKIEGNGSKNVTITFDAAQLKIVAANPTIGRTIDAAWLGVKVMAPKDIDIATLKQATYENGPSSAEKSFWSNQDSTKSESESDDHYINVFGAVTEDILKSATKEGTMIKYSWIFDWNNDDTDDQIVTILINPANIELSAKDTDTVLWNQDTYKALNPDNVLEEGPKTGDNIMTFAGLMVVSAASVGYAFKKLREDMI